MKRDDQLPHRLLDLIRQLTDADPCDYDHNGVCQAHSLDPRPCPHETAKELLAVADLFGEPSEDKDEWKPQPGTPFWKDVPGSENAV